MARIAGVDLPLNKRVEIGLTYIFGIGRKTAQDILQKTGVDASQRIRDLNDADVNKLRQAIERGHGQGYLKATERDELAAALEARHER